MQRPTGSNRRKRGCLSLPRNVLEFPCRNTGGVFFDLCVDDPDASGHVINDVEVRSLSLTVVANDDGHALARVEPAEGKPEDGLSLPQRLVRNTRVTLLAEEVDARVARLENG